MKMNIEPLKCLKCGDECAQEWVCFSCGQNKTNPHPHTEFPEKEFLGGGTSKLVLIKFEEGNDECLDKALAYVSFHEHQAIWLYDDHSEVDKNIHFDWIYIDNLF